MGTAVTSRPIALSARSNARFTTAFQPCSGLSVTSTTGMPSKSSTLGFNRKALDRSGTKRTAAVLSASAASACSSARHSSRASAR